MGNAEYMGVRRLFDIMKVIAAYMLAVTGGNDSPNVADCKKILSSVGVNLAEDEEKRLEDLVEEMAGSGLAEVLEKGAAAPGAAPAAEEKKESSDDDDDEPIAAGGLFGEDGGDDY